MQLSSTEDNPQKCEHGGVTDPIARARGLAPAARSALVLSMAAGGPFSRPLQEVARFGLPPVFVSCTKWLKQRALTEEGLFRKKADARLLLSVKRAYEDGRDPIATGEVQCPHTVAGVLRLWLSCIPGHVVPGHLVKLCCNAQLAPCHVSRLELLRSVLSKADTYVLELLFSLAEFLHHYRLNQRGARLPPPDLARVFAPLLLRLPLDATFEEKELAVAAAEMLIADYRPIFTRPRCAAVAALDPSTPPPPSAVPSTTAAAAVLCLPTDPGTAGAAAAAVAGGLGPSPGKGPLSPRSPSPKSPASPSSRIRPGPLAPTSLPHGLPGSPGCAAGSSTGGSGGAGVTGSPKGSPGASPCPSPPPSSARGGGSPVRLLSAAQRAAAESVEAGLVTPGRIGLDAVMGDCTWLQLRAADLPERSDDSELSSDGSSCGGGGRLGNAYIAAAAAKHGLHLDDLLLLDGLSLSGDSEDGDAAEEAPVDCELLGLVSALLAGATTQLF